MKVPGWAEDFRPDANAANRLAAYLDHLGLRWPQAVGRMAADDYYEMAVEMLCAAEKWPDELMDLSSPKAERD